VAPALRDSELRRPSALAVPHVDDGQQLALFVDHEVHVAFRLFEQNPHEMRALLRRAGRSWVLDGSEMFDRFEKLASVKRCVVAVP